MKQWFDRGQGVEAKTVEGLEGSDVQREGDEKWHCRGVNATVSVEEDIDGAPDGF